MSELSSVVVLARPDDGLAGTVPGHAVHGWLLGRVLRERYPALADRMHRDERHKGFTVSPAWPMPADDPGVPEQWRGLHWLRLTGIDAEVSARLLELEAEHLAALQADGRRLVPLAVARSARAHPLAGRIAARELWRRKVQQECEPGPVRFRFVSPTSFAGHDGACILPLADLIVKSLAHKWNRWCGDEVLRVPAEVIESLARGTRPCRYHLRTETGHFGEPGFVGEVDFETPRDAGRRLERWLFLLRDFAFFAGVGQRTTMGMGQALLPGV